MSKVKRLWRGPQPDLLQRDVLRAACCRAVDADLGLSRGFGLPVRRGDAFHRRGGAATHAGVWQGLRELSHPG